MNAQDIEIVNKITGKNKLIDRITQIRKLGGKITFKKVTSETFYQNLQYIDSRFPELLGEILLKSYELGNKNLETLLEHSSTFSNNKITKHKLKEFLTAISFGMMPSKEWDGSYTANGGIIFVLSTGKVCVLDNIYYTREVQQYLLSETKLDSPSSTRYHMLELQATDNPDVYCFTLNLQIRYKR